MAQAINYLIPLWIVKFAVSQIGMTQFGNYAYYSYIFVFTNNLLLYGFTYFGTSLVAKNKSNPSYLQEIFNDSIIAKIILLIGFFPIMVLFIVSQKDILNFWILLSGLIYLLGGVFLTDWFWQGMSHFNFILKATAIGKIIFILLCWSLLPKFPNANGLLFFDAFSYLVAAFLMYLNFSERNFKFNLTKVLFLLKLGFPTFVSVFLTGFFITLNGVFLRIYQGDTATGIFSTADKIIFICVGFLNLFNRVIYPRLSKAYSDNLNSYPFLVQKNLIFLLSISVGCGLTMFFIADYVVPFVVNENIPQVSKIVKYLVLYISLSPVGSFLSLILIINQREKHLMIVTFISAVSNITLSIYLVPRYAVIGTCISISISAVIIPLLLLIYYNRTILFYEKNIIANS